MHYCQVSLKNNDLPKSGRISHRAISTHFGRKPFIAVIIPNLSETMHRLIRYWIQICCLISYIFGTFQNWLDSWYHKTHKPHNPYITQPIKLTFSSIVFSILFQAMLCTCTCTCSVTDKFMCCALSIGFLSLNKSQEYLSNYLRKSSH